MLSKPILLAALLCSSLTALAAPIHEAVKSGDQVAVERILKADPGQLQAADQAHSNTPLHWAAYRGNLAIVKLLVKRGARLEARTKEGYTPLRDAAYQGHFEVVDYLLSRGARAQARDNARGATPLHWAAEGGRTEVIGLLACQSGVSPLLLDRQGFTALDWARQAGHKKTETEMRRECQRWVYNECSKNRVEELRPIFQHHPELVQSRMLGMPGESTLLHSAPSVEMARMLLDYGADIGALSYPGGDGSFRGITPLLTQALIGNAAVVRLLVERGADPNYEAEGRNTALDLAVSAGRIQAVEALLQAGANPNHQNSWGHTAMHQNAESRAVLRRREATPQRQLEIARLLISAHANLNLKDSRGFTPLAYARFNHNLELEKFLSSQGAR